VTVKSDTIRQAVDATSPLRRLSILDVDWTEEGVVSLWSQLRTNESLELLHIDDIDEDECSAVFNERMRETLATFNWMLHDVRGYENDLPVHDLLEQNARIRKVVSVLEGRNYGVDQVALWPTVMGRVSSKPTLLFRLLRRGDSDAWSALVLSRLGRNIVLEEASTSVNSFAAPSWSLATPPWLPLSFASL
jgi:hypothetical protein